MQVHHKGAYTSSMDSMELHHKEGDRSSLEPLSIWRYFWLPIQSGPKSSLDTMPMHQKGDDKSSLDPMELHHKEGDRSSLDFPYDTPSYQSSLDVNPVWAQWNFTIKNLTDPIWIQWNCTTNKVTDPVWNHSHLALLLVLQATNPVWI